MEDGELKNQLTKLKEQRIEINDEISRIEKECQHIWKHGSIGVDSVIYKTERKTH